MRGKYGKLLNWGKWTPKALERYEMFEAVGEEGEEA